MLWNFRHLATKFSASKASSVIKSWNFQNQARQTFAISGNGAFGFKPHNFWHQVVELLASGGGAFGIEPRTFIIKPRTITNNLWSIHEDAS